MEKRQDDKLSAKYSYGLFFLQHIFGDQFSVDSQLICLKYTYLFSLVYNSLFEILFYFHSLVFEINLNPDSCHLFFILDHENSNGNTIYSCPWLRSYQVTRISLRMTSTPNEWSLF